MLVGIDASNIKTGGGKVHLTELINTNVDDNFIILCPVETAHSINNKNVKFIYSSANTIMSLYQKFIYFQFILYFSKVDIVLVPGSIYLGFVRPYVSIFQNMLPFDKQIRGMYKFKISYFRYLLLEILYLYSFKKASGVIFLSEYGQDVINNYCKLRNQKIIAHGVSEKFKNFYKRDFDIDLSDIRVVYLSPITLYKNHFKLIKSLASYLKKNPDIIINLDCIGNINDKVIVKKCLDYMNKVPCDNLKLRFIGNVNHDDLPRVLVDYDFSFFVSSCENLPITLMEIQTLGLPAIILNKRPNSDVSSSFMIENVNNNEVEFAVTKIISSIEFRRKLSQLYLDQSKIYSWKICAESTFCFLREVADEDTTYC